jgi:glycosyltransferase involved in cell wall biosynthesis
MIVKNEACHLQACLDSVRSVSSELIVVDTGSADATREIAAGNGAKVFDFDFAHVDFSAARNHGIAHAIGRWILVLDADETLHPASLPLISALAAHDENVGYYAVRHNPSTLDYAVRLFPNRPDYRYRGRVHETVDYAILRAGGRLLKTGIRIDHNSSPGKNHGYIEILKDEIAADPSGCTDDTRLDFLAAEYHQLGMFQEAAAVAERIVQARPLDPSAHLNAGIYHLMFTSDPVRARADFAQALSLKPGYAEAISFLETLER